jgi:hypothetical protein
VCPIKRADYLVVFAGKADLAEEPRYGIPSPLHVIPGFARSLSDFVVDL